VWYTLYCTLLSARLVLRSLCGVLGAVCSALCPPCSILGTVYSAVRTPYCVFRTGCCAPYAWYRVLGSGVATLCRLLCITYYVSDTAGGILCFVNSGVYTWYCVLCAAYSELYSLGCALRVACLARYTLLGILRTVWSALFAVCRSPGTVFSVLCALHGKLGALYSLTYFPYCVLDSISYGAVSTPQPTSGVFITAWDADRRFGSYRAPLARGIAPAHPSRGSVQGLNQMGLGTGAAMRERRALLRGQGAVG
jgi:hypothetical protein